MGGRYVYVRRVDLETRKYIYIHPKENAPQFLHRSQRIEPEEGGPALVAVDAAGGPAVVRGGVCSGGGGGVVVEAGHHHGAGEAAVLCRWGWGTWRWVGLVLGDGPVGGWVDGRIFMNTPIRHETTYIYTPRGRGCGTCAPAPWSARAGGGVSPAGPPPPVVLCCCIVVSGCVDVFVWVELHTHPTRVYRPSIHQHKHTRL